MSEQHYYAGVPLVYDEPSDNHLVYVNPKLYQMFCWYTDVLPKWAGRDWRRIKREQRKHMRAIRKTWKEGL